MSIEQAIANLTALKAQLPNLVGNEMINYALDNIDNQGFDGSGWPARSSKSPRNEGRKLLIDTGAGRRSIEISHTDSNSVEITAIDYMQYNNDGFSGSENVKSFTRNKTSRVRSGSGRGKKQATGQVETVRGFTRQMNLPQRQFIGESPVLTSRIAELVSKKIIQAVT